MILAVTGGKGGVGKSTIAFHLAAELDAVVVDADLAMADLPGGRGPDLHDVLAGRASAPEAVREDAPVPILPCGRSLAGARAADPTALVETVRAVERDHGAVVIDSPAGLRADVGLPLYAADACLVVTTPDPAALADAMRVRALARQCDAGLVRVALNRAEPGRSTRRIADHLGAPVVPVPEDDAVERARECERPLAAHAPSSPARAAILDLAAAVQSCSAW